MKLELGLPHLGGGKDSPRRERGQPRNERGRRSRHAYWASPLPNDQFSLNVHLDTNLRNDRTIPAVDR
jgi:hypothetical protein